MRTAKIFCVYLLTAGVACSQNKPAAPPPAGSVQDHKTMQHEHQDGSENSSGAQKARFMQGSMNHAIAKGVTLEAKVDAAAHTITLRIGPMTMPANTDHMTMPQPPDLTWAVPMNGWLLAYHPRLVDASGNAVRGTVLHHVAFWNENRADFLCPNKEEHIFGAGSEMTDWMRVPGFGYRVEKGDQIRVETMIYNPTGISYDKVYLEVVISTQDANESGAAPVKSYYPAWMDVKSCGDSSYDLPAGKSEQNGTVTVKYDGVLLGVGGHMHDYARQIVLEDASRKEAVASLDALVDPQGHLEAMPVKTYFQEGGYKLSANDVLKISATYDNPTGKVLREGAMGIVVGYFVPADEAKMAALRHKPSHDRAGMTHEH